MLLSFYVILYRTAMAEAKSEVNKTRHFVSMIPLHVLNREVSLSGLPFTPPARFISLLPHAPDSDHARGLSITDPHHSIPCRNPSPSCASSYQRDRRRRRIQHPLVGTAGRKPSKTPRSCLPLEPARVGVERDSGGSGQNRSSGGASFTLRALCD